jgi:glycosyltransferase involved in cell wall biosynthesis
MRVTLPIRSDRMAGVTAVIPCYNYGHYLPQAVDSVLGQPGVDARVIIVDDCSTDNSLSVAEDLAKRDSRVTVLAHAANAGHIATYNDGLAAVTTEYLTLVSADDLVAPGALGRAAELMNAHPRVGMVYGQPVEFTTEPPSSDRDSLAPLTWTRWGGPEWIRIACRRGRNFILSPEVVMRTEAVRQIGGYNAALPKSGDLEYWLRTASKWEVGRVNGRVQAFYRQHGGNMHEKEYSTMSADLLHRLLAFRFLESTELSSFVHSARLALSREAIGIAVRELETGGRTQVAGDLLAAAADIHPSSVSTRRVRRLHAIVQQTAGAETVGTASAGPARSIVAPSPIRRPVLYLRSIVDRVRWRLWVHTGVS